MHVTNLTDHTFVLAAGVILQPNASDVEVADALYQSDTLLNQQLDSMEAHGIVSITGKPSDTFPPPVASDADGQVTLTASAADKTPLTLVAATGQTANLLEVYDENGELTTHVSNDGAVRTPGLYVRTAVGDTLIAQIGNLGSQFSVTEPDAVPMQIYAVPDQTANLLEAYDENSDLVFQIAETTRQSWAFGDGALEIDGIGTSSTVILDDDQPGNGGITLDSEAGLTIFLGDPTATGLEVHAKSGQSVPIVNIVGADGNPVFRINADGTVHIKTGGTVHADL